MAENETTEGGVGLKLDVILSADIDEKHLEGELGKKLDSALDSNVNSLRDKSKDLNESLLKIRDFIQRVAEVNKTVRGSTSTRELAAIIPRLSEQLSQVQAASTKGGQIKASAAFGADADVLRKSLEQSTALLNTPSVHRAAKKAGLQDPSQLFGQFNNAIKSYNKSFEGFVGNYGFSAIDKVSKAFDQIRPQKTFRGNQMNRFMEQFINDKVRTSVYAPRNKRGFTFDVETLNAQGDLGQLAYNNAKGGVTTLNRDLSVKGAPKMDRFNQLYLPTVKPGQSGVELGKMVSEFHDAWATFGNTFKDGKPYLGKDIQLAQPVGHNLEFDLRRMLQAAQQVPKSAGPEFLAKASAVETSISRILNPEGDQRHLLAQGDTMKLFEKFMQDTMGFKDFKNLGGGANIGSKLSSIASAFGIDYQAHDAGADTRLTQTLFTALSNKKGREGLKQAFNPDAWFDAIERDTLGDRFRQSAVKTYISENDREALSKTPEGKAELRKREAEIETQALDYFNHREAKVRKVGAGGLYDVPYKGFPAAEGGVMTPDQLLKNEKGRLTENVNRIRDAYWAQTEGFTEAVTATKSTTAPGKVSKKVQSIRQELLDKLLRSVDESVRAANIMAGPTKSVEQGIRNVIGNYEGHVQPGAPKVTKDLDNFVGNLGIRKDSPQATAIKQALSDAVTTSYMEYGGLDITKMARAELLSKEAMDDYRRQQMSLGATALEAEEGVRKQQQDIPKTNYHALTDFTGKENEFASFQKNLKTTALAAISSVGHAIDSEPFPTEFKTREDFRVSDYVSSGKKPSEAGYRSIESLIQQVQGGGITQKKQEGKQFLRGHVFEALGIDYLQKDKEFTDRYELMATGGEYRVDSKGKLQPVSKEEQAKQTTLRGGFLREGETKLGPGNSIVGHPDGIMRDRETGRPMLFEAKYRGKDKLEDFSAGNIPKSYRMQASLYSAMAGLPDMSTMFMFGDLVAENAKTRELEKTLTRTDLKPEARLMYEQQLADEKKRIPITDHKLGNLRLMEVAPDQDMVKSIQSELAKIFGSNEKFTASGLDKAIRAAFGTSGDIPNAKELNALAKRFNAEKLGQGVKAAGQVMNHREVKAVDKTIQSLMKLAKETEATAASAKHASTELAQLDIAETGNAGGGNGGFSGGSGSAPPNPEGWRPSYEKYTEDERQDLLAKETERQRRVAEKARLELRGVELYKKKKLGAKVLDEDGNETGVYEGRLSKWEEDNLKRIKETAQNKFDDAVTQLGVYEAQMDTLGKTDGDIDPFARFKDIDAIDRDVQMKEYKQQEKALANAYAARVGLGFEGITPETFKTAFSAAREVEKLGLEGPPGMTRAQLAQMAASEGVKVDTGKLKDVTGGMKTTAARDSLKGTDSVKTFKAEVLTAAKAVDALFNQLADNSTANFMSDEAQSIQGFIQKSQEAQKRANDLRATAELTGEAAKARRAEGGKGSKAEVDELLATQKKYETQAKAAETRARNLAGQAKTEYDKLEQKQYTPEFYKQELELKQEEERKQLQRRAAQLEARQAMPGYQLTRKDRDEASYIGRRTMALKHGTETRLQGFDRKTEVQISTREAEEKLHNLKVKLKQESIALKANLEIGGANAEALRSIIQNNLNLAMKGIQTPGVSTVSAFKQARDAGINLSGVETKKFDAYYQSLQGSPFQHMQMPQDISAYNDFIQANKLGEQNMSNLYSELSKYTDVTKGMDSTQSAVYAQDKLVRKGIDEVAGYDFERRTLEEQSKQAKLAGNDRLAKQLSDQAKSAGVERDKAQLRVKRELLELEKKIQAIRVDPTGSEATKKMTTQIRAQLAAEKEQLLIEQKQLAIRLQETKQASQQDISRGLQINDQLSRMGVSQKNSPLTNADLHARAKRDGVQLDPGMGGGRKNKDFVSGALDLIDWQLQWSAGMAVLGGVSQALKNSIGFAIQYEAVLKNIELITQANTAEMAQLESQISSLASTYQYSANELGQGLVILGQAGFTAVESLKILPQIAALATATMSDLAIAADITTTAIHAFDIPTQGVDSLVNALAAMTIESKLDIEKLGTSFNYVASAASAAGLTIEETGTAMGLMSNAGVRASTIGTSLRSVIGSLMNPTEKFRAALNDVGLTVDDVNPQTNELGEIFKKLKAAGFDVSSAFAGLDKRIAGAAITLIESSDKFDSFEASITGTSRASRMAIGQMDTLQAQAKRLQNTFQLLGGSLFNPSLGPLKDTVHVLNTILITLKKIVDAVPGDLTNLAASTISSTLLGSVGFGFLGGVGSLVSGTRKSLKKEVMANAGPSYMELRSDPEFINASRSERKRRVRQVSRNSRKQLIRTGARGGSLSGLQGKGYSLFTTFFDPKMLGTMALVTAGMIAVGHAMDKISGKALMMKDLELADKFESEAAAIKELSEQYLAATEGTLEYMDAKRQLEKLKVDTSTPESIKSALAARQTQAELKRVDSIESRIAYKQSGTYSAKRLGMTEVEKEQDDRANADLFSEGLKRRGLFYNGSRTQIYDALAEMGVDTENEVSELAMRRMFESITSARNTGDLDRLRGGEASSTLRRSSATITNSEESLKKAQERFAKADAEFTEADRQRAQDIEDMVGYGTTDEDPTPNEYLDARREVERLEKLRRQAKEDRQSSAENYINTVMTQEDGKRYTGSQEQANNALIKTYNSMQETRGKIAELGSLGLSPEELTAQSHMLNKELEAQEKSIQVQFKTAALLSGFKPGEKGGMSRENLQLGVDLFDLLATGSIEEGYKVDTAAKEALEGLPIQRLKEFTEKFVKLTEEKKGEMAQLKTYFGKLGTKELPEDITAAIELKYQIKAEELQQAELDAAVKPISDALNKIKTQIDEQVSTQVARLESQYTAEGALRKVDYDMRKINMASAGTTTTEKSIGFFGQQIATGYIPGYTSGQAFRDKMAFDRSNLQEDYQKSSKVYGTKLAGIREQREIDFRDFSNREFATPSNRMKAQFELEMKYLKMAIEARREWKDKSIGYINQVTEMMGNYASRIDNVKQAKANSDMDFDRIIDQSREKRFERSSKIQNMTRLSQVRTLTKEAQTHFDNKNFAEAETVRKRIVGLLDQVNSSGTKVDQMKVEWEATKLKDIFGENYDAQAKMLELAMDPLRVAMEDLKIAINTLNGDLTPEEAKKQREDLYAKQDKEKEKQGTASITTESGTATFDSLGNGNYAEVNGKRVPLPKDSLQAVGTLRPENKEKPMKESSPENAIKDLVTKVLNGEIGQGQTEDLLSLSTAFAAGVKPGTDIEDTYKQIQEAAKKISEQDATRLEQSIMTLSEAAGDNLFATFFTEFENNVQDLGAILAKSTVTALAEAEAERLKGIKGEQGKEATDLKSTEEAAEEKKSQTVIIKADEDFRKAGLKFIVDDLNSLS